MKPLIKITLKQKRLPTTQAYLFETKSMAASLKSFCSIYQKYPESEFIPQALYEWAWAQKSLKKADQAILLYERIIKITESNLSLKVQAELAELNLMGGQRKR